MQSHFGWRLLVWRSALTFVVVTVVSAGALAFGDETRKRARQFALHHRISAAVGASAMLVLAACATSVPQSSPSVTTTTTWTVPIAAPTVSSILERDLGVRILADVDGLPLYVWDQDHKPGASSCIGGCAHAWPPLDVVGTPSFGPGVRASIFSTVTGPYGELQLAVNRRPLYRWANDQRGGGATGQGFNGFFVVGVDGKPIPRSG